MMPPATSKRRAVLAGVDAGGAGDASTAFSASGAAAGAAAVGEAGSGDACHMVRAV